jgi:ABC-type branched-subunit amino acid transport system permease subunit
MVKIAALFYVIVAPTVMGVLVTVALLTPALFNGAGITAAAVLGAVLALPISWWITKALRGPVRPA